MKNNIYTVLFSFLVIFSLILNSCYKEEIRENITIYTDPIPETYEFFKSPCDSLVKDNEYDTPYGDYDLNNDLKYGISSDFYYIKASGWGHNLYIYFPSSSLPAKSKVYDIANKDLELLSDNEVKLVHNNSYYGPTHIYDGESGKLYYNRTDSILTITFCDIDLKSYYVNSYQGTLTGRIFDLLY